jgi:hypothetical protein
MTTGASSFLPAIDLTVRGRRPCCGAKNVHRPGDGYLQRRHADTHRLSIVRLQLQLRGQGRTEPANRSVRRTDIAGTNQPV